MRVEFEGRERDLFRAILDEAVARAEYAPTSESEWEDLPIEWDESLPRYIQVCHFTVKDVMKRLPVGGAQIRSEVLRVIRSMDDIGLLAQGSIGNARRRDFEWLNRWRLSRGYGSYLDAEQRDYFSKLREECVVRVRGWIDAAWAEVEAS